MSTRTFLGHTPDDTRTPLSVTIFDDPEGTFLQIAFYEGGRWGVPVPLIEEPS